MKTDGTGTTSKRETGETGSKLQQQGECQVATGDVTGASDANLLLQRYKTAFALAAHSTSPRAAFSAWLWPLAKVRPSKAPAASRGQR